MSILKPAQIFDPVEKLTEDVQYTVAGVERILGPIGLQKSSEYSNDHFEVYEARCDDSKWLKYVELRAPTTNHPSGGRLLIVELKEGVGREIGYEQILLHYGDNYLLDVPYPEAPLEDPLGLVYSRDWGKIYFGITRDFEELVGISIHVD